MTHRTKLLQDVHSKTYVSKLELRNLERKLDMFDQFVKWVELYISKILFSELQID